MKQLSGLSLIKPWKEFRQNQLTDEEAVDLAFEAIYNGSADIREKLARLGMKSFKEMQPGVLYMLPPVEQEDE